MIVLHCGTIGNVHDTLLNVARVWNECSGWAIGQCCCAVRWRTTLCAVAWWRSPPVLLTACWPGDAEIPRPVPPLSPPATSPLFPPFCLLYEGVSQCTETSSNLVKPPLQCTLKLNGQKRSKDSLQAVIVFWPIGNQVYNEIEWSTS